MCCLHESLWKALAQRRQGVHAQDSHCPVGTVKAPRSSRQATGFMESTDQAGNPFCPAPDPRPFHCTPVLAPGLAEVQTAVGSQSLSPALHCPSPLPRSQVCFLLGRFKPPLRFPDIKLFPRPKLSLPPSDSFSKLECHHFHYPVLTRHSPFWGPQLYRPFLG